MHSHNTTIQSGITLNQFNYESHGLNLYSPMATVKTKRNSQMTLLSQTIAEDKSQPHQSFMKSSILQKFEPKQNLSICNPSRLRSQRLTTINKHSSGAFDLEETANTTINSPGSASSDVHGKFKTLDVASHDTRSIQQKVYARNNDITNYLNVHDKWLNYNRPRYARNKYQQ